ncbi:MAG: hypothetical protein ABEJ30_03625 [Halorientalis sp.]
MSRPNRVGVFAGTCTVTEDAIHVSHDPWRVLHPWYVLLIGGFVTLGTYSLFTGAPLGHPASLGGVGWLFAYGTGLALVGAGLVQARQKRVLTDHSIPLRDVVGVRIETESRRGYFKQSDEVPVVVVEYATGSGTETYPIRLHRRERDHGREVARLRSLLAERGMYVEEATGEPLRSF